MRLVHRRKERVLTPQLSQLNYRLSRCCYCSEEKRGTKDRGVRESKEGEESYSRLLDSMGKGLWRAGLPMNTNTRIRLGFRSLIRVGGSGKQAATGGRVEAGTAGAGTLTFSSLLLWTLTFSPKQQPIRLERIYLIVRVKLCYSLSKHELNPSGRHERSRPQLGTGLNLNEGTSINAFRFE